MTDTELDLARSQVAMLREHAYSHAQITKKVDKALNTKGASHAK